MVSSVNKKTRINIYVGLVLIALGLLVFYYVDKQLYLADQTDLNEQAKSKVAKETEPKEGTTILVKADAATIEKLIKDENLTKVSEIKELGIVELKPAADSDDTAAEKARKIHATFQKDKPDKVAKNEFFAEVEKLHPPQATTPNDPWYVNWGWHLKKMQGPLAWDTATGSSDVTIAILDTGMNSTHEDLQPNIVAGWNWYDNNADTSDTNGHGTNVGGAAAARTNNALGVAAVCWTCKIMPIRVSDSLGYGSGMAMAKGLIWAADRGARMANISYSVTGMASISSAANYFRSKGGVVSVSSGNSGTFINYPDDPDMITVGASDGNDNLFSYSTTGPHLDITAPGSAYTTLKSGGYFSVGGTSISAPLVAGVAAVAYSANPSAFPATLAGSQQLEEVLKSAVVDLGPAGWDTSFGWGRTDLAQAVAIAKALPAGGGTPTPDTTAPSVPTGVVATATSGTTVAVSWVASTDNVGVKDYVVYRDGTEVGRATSLTYLDSGLTPSTSYSYTVKATDAAGNTSAASTAASATTPAPADTTPPTAPADLSGSATSPTSISLTWTASTDNVGIKDYQVWRNGGLIATVTSPSHTDSTVSGGTTYSYTVKARDAAGNVSAASNTATVTTPTPPVVFSFTVIPYISAKTSTTATVVFTTSTASTATVKYGTSATALSLTATDTASSTDHAVSLSGLTAGKTYYFQVEATAADGTKLTSSTSSFKTPRGGSKRR